MRLGRRHRRGHRARRPSRGLATGRLHLQTEAIDASCRPTLPTARGDNQILAVVMFLVEKHPGRNGHPGVEGHQHAHQGACARARREDYFNDKVLGRTATCCTPAPASCRPTSGDSHARGIGRGRRAGRTSTASRPLAADDAGQRVRPPGRRQPAAGLGEGRKAGRRAVGPSPTTATPRTTSGASPARNREQNFALNLLMNPEIDFVTLLGQAGTGKTLLTLAAGPRRCWSRSATARSS